MRPEPRRRAVATQEESEEESVLAEPDDSSWPSKADCEESTETLWGNPTQTLQQGAFRGIVERISEDGVYVRLLWEASDGPHLQGQRLVPSPVVGLIDAEAFVEAFSAEFKVEDVRLYLREDQHVSVLLHAQEAGTLVLRLSPLQPTGPPPKLPPFTQQKTLEEGLSGLLRAHNLRVGGMSSLVGLAQVSPPPGSADDEQWAPWLRDVSTESSNVPPLVAAGWALADNGRDLAVAGPLTSEARALLYAVPLLRHWRAQPRAVRGSGPAAVVLGPRILRNALQELLAQHDIEVQNVEVNNHNQLVRVRHCSVALMCPRVFATAVRKKGIFSRVSLVAVDDLGFWAHAQREGLQNFLRLLPQRKWGSSIVWLDKWRPAVEPAIQGFAEAPVTLRAADSVLGAEVIHELLRPTDTARRLAYYMFRYPGRRMVIFANDPEVLVARLRRAGARWSRRSPVIAPNRAPWSNKGQALDLVLHVDAPPSLEEYHKRLAVCRERAVTLLTVDKSGKQLDLSWSLFASQRASSTGLEERRVLLNYTRNARMIVERLRSRRSDEGSGSDTGSSFEYIFSAENARAARSRLDRTFDEDYSMGEDGRLVWDAGQEKLDEEVAVFSDIL